MNIRLLREIFGYLLGGVVFVGLLPLLMWIVSCQPALWPIEIVQLIICTILIIIGLAMSVWAIVYMKNVGDGNPMDAFNNEIAPRTKHLMTEGPYRISRNPMLTGIFLYLIGCGIWLLTWQALVFFVVFVLIMLLQVRSEEKRLRRDFDEEYGAYCQRTGRFWPTPLRKA